MTVKPIRLGLKERLKNPRARARFLSVLAQDEIADQIRQLRVKRGFSTQTAFAKKAQMQQSAVSRIEQSEYSGWTFRTLLKVAVALDARLRVSFEPIEHLLSKADRSESAAELEGLTSVSLPDESVDLSETEDDSYLNTMTVDPIEIERPVVHG